MVMSAGTTHHGFGFMWFVDLLLTVLVVIGGIQDFRSGEVSNWITIPLLLAGIAACLLRMNDAQGILSAILIVIVTVFFALQTMGGADWKVLVGTLRHLAACGTGSSVGRRGLGPDRDAKDALTACAFSGRHRVRFRHRLDFFRRSIYNAANQ